MSTKMLETCHEILFRNSLWKFSTIKEEEELRAKKKEDERKCDSYPFPNPIFHFLTLPYFPDEFEGTFVRYKYERTNISQSLIRSRRVNFSRFLIFFFVKCKQLCWE